MERMFRLLKADEIECRVAQIKKDGTAVSLLLYKDARVDMSLLDEVVGAENWQRKHELINGNLFCSVGVKKDGEWVWKQDVGVESNTEAEKGQASDAFKRACTNWGIGRELYTAPDIWVNIPNCNIITGERPKCYDRFRVSRIEYDAANRISALQIINAKTGKTVYTFGAKAAPKAEAAPVDDAKAKAEFFQYVQSCNDGKGMCPESVEKICKAYKLNALTDISPAQCRDYMEKLRAHRAKEAAK